MRNTLSQDFFAGLTEAEARLHPLRFTKKPGDQTGLAHYVEYRNENHTVVLFLFGPADWHVDIVVTTKRGKFVFKDLLAMPTIATWFSHNRLAPGRERQVKQEVRWFVDLLLFALPLIE